MSFVPPPGSSPAPSGGWQPPPPVPTPAGGYVAPTPPAPPHRSRRGIYIGIVAGLVLVLLVVGAASLASRASRGTPLDQLRRAECFNVDSGLFGEKAIRVPCAKRHTDEVAGFITFPGGVAGYPGRDGILELGKNGCPLQVTEFYGQKPLGNATTFVFGPDEAAWEKGERTVVCSLREPSGAARRGSYLDQ